MELLDYFVSKEEKTPTIRTAEYQDDFDLQTT
jgi:hypothetical protein